MTSLIVATSITLAIQPTMEAAAAARPVIPKLGEKNRPGVQQVKALKAGVFRGVRTQPHRDKSTPLNAAPAPVTWPGAGEAVVDLSGPAATPRTVGSQQGRVKAGDLPVWVAPATTLAALRDGNTPPVTPGQVKVQLKDHHQAAQVGVDGLLLTVENQTNPVPTAQAPSSTDATPTPTGETKSSIEVQLDYSSFAGAHGGDWASRLHLSQLPACALTTPDKAECRISTPLASRNNPATATLSAQIDIPSTTAPAPDGQATSRAATAPATASAPVMVLAAEAEASGPGGDWTGSSLSPSATWSAGSNTGGFGWSYPLGVPPVPGDLTPSLALSYSSASTDGKSSASNTQASWVGEGFDLWPGYIERRYNSCSDDGNKSLIYLTGALCWGTANATMMLNGSGTQLVYDNATRTWHGKSDDGSTIESLSGAANGDSDGEYWKVTTTDGTQYFFGLNRPGDWSDGKEETDSVLTVPVVGDDTDEPCHDGYGMSPCKQAWRWNLDYVVDPNGNALTYFYGRETNHYSHITESGQIAALSRSYHSGGYLKRIDYGQRAGHLYDTPAVARVIFDTADRTDFPDDRVCDSDYDCGEKKLSPTFFDRKRLTKITTELRSGSGYSPVDSWTLGQSYLQGLWLDSITRTGHVGGTKSTPPVTFAGTLLDNRVVSPDPTGGGTGVDMLPPYKRARITAIDNGTGGVTSINYATPECSFDAANMPSPKSNTRRCYPVYWAPPGYEDPVLDWFQKHTVDSVVESDQRGGTVQKITAYTYKGGAAWHYADDDGLTKDKYRTWSDFRGFATVETVSGDPNSGDPLSRTSTTYLRGMDGDFQGDGQPKRAASMSDSRGELTVTDADYLAGSTLESRTFNGAFTDADELSSSIGQPWAKKTATRTASWGEVEAYMVRTAWSKKRTKKADGAASVVETRYSFDSLGRTIAVDDEGDTATAVDDQCIRTVYPAGSTDLTDAAIRELTVARDCDDAASSEPNLVSGQVVSDVKIMYDGQAFGAAPTKGNATAVETLIGVTAGKTTTQLATTTSYDAFGRATSSTAVGDPATTADDRTTSSSYVHDLAGWVKQVTMTSSKISVGGAAAAGFTTTTTFEPGRSQPVLVVDANNRKAEADYDPLGRLTASWLPGRDKATYPTTPTNRYAYTLPAATSTTPASVTTEAIRTSTGTGTTATATYAKSVQLLDGLLRNRQTQTEADNGQRLVTDIFYDSRGLASKSNGAYLATGAPTGTLASIADNTVPSQTVTTFDGAARPTASILYSAGKEKWRTTTTYTGSHTVTVTPPAGAMPTTTVSDARGRTLETRQYTSTSLTGSFETTKYGYDGAGRQTTVTGPDGAVWTTEYDPRGRIAKQHDPDKGTTSYAYTAFNEVASVTDARGITLSSSYDALGRKRELKQASTVLAAWTYDTLAKGYLTSATRYVGSDAYISEITGYDPRYRSYGTKVTIPAIEGKLAGTYTTTQSYNLDGTPRTTAYPAAGDLTAENVTTYYDTLGRPEWNTGTSTYVADTVYTGLNEVAQVVMGSVAGKSVSQTFEYEDGTRRLKSAMVDRENIATDDSTLTYAYTNTGAITSITNAAGTSVDRQCFTSDHQQRLTQAWTVTGTTACTSAPTKTSIGGPAPYWHTYAYNSGGSRTGETQKAFGTATTDTVRTYTPAAPLGTSGKTSPHALTKVAQTGPTARTDTFTYDNIGNTTKRVIGTTTQTLDWNAEGDLVKVTEGTKVTEFVYDADGNRLLRKDPATVTLYLPGQEVALSKTTQNTACTRYYTHAGDTVAMRTVTGVKFILSDHHDTGEVQVDGSTQAVTQRRSLPFGGPRGTTTGTWAGDKGFVGGTRDATTGLTHLGAREYDPATGRFISVDPVFDAADSQALNGYNYANSNPLNLSDPTGLTPCFGVEGVVVNCKYPTLTPDKKATAKPADPGHNCCAKDYKPPRGDKSNYDPNEGYADEDAAYLAKDKVGLRIGEIDVSDEIATPEFIKRYRASYHNVVEQWVHPLLPDSREENEYALGMQICEGGGSDCGTDFMMDLHQAHMGLVPGGSDITGEIISGGAAMAGVGRAVKGTIANLRKGNSKAAALGTAVHNSKEWKDKLKSMGYSEGSEVSPGNIPDGFTHNGYPVELKPATKSGIRAGTRQLRRYMNEMRTDHAELWTYNVGPTGGVEFKVTAIPAGGRRWLYTG